MAAPETTCSNIESGTFISIGSGVVDHFIGDWLQAVAHAREGNYRCLLVCLSVRPGSSNFNLGLYSTIELPRAAIYQPHCRVAIAPPLLATPKIHKCHALEHCEKCISGLLVAFYSCTLSYAYCHEDA